MSKNKNKKPTFGKPTPAGTPAAMDRSTIHDYIHSEPEKHTYTVSQTKQELPLKAANFKLIGIGLAILALGYILLGAEDYVDLNAPHSFSVALNIAPVLIVGGYAWIIYAIMFQKKAK